ncbi:hypothetical protein DL98DRAFT_439894, partial [Cadophora sp. DSE1049]
HIRETSRRLWIPGRDIVVDEAMSRYQGRSKDILKIPGKPIDRGYKIWVLADQGFFYDWVFHRKGTKKNDPDRGKLGLWKVL